MNKTITIMVYSLAGGGTEKVTVHVANYLHKIGYKVEIILLKRAGDYLSLVSEEIPVKAIWWISHPVFFSMPAYLSGVFSLFCYLLIHKPYRLLCIGEWPNILGPVAAFPFRRAIKVIISVRSSKGFLNEPSAYGLPSIFKFIAGASYPLADRIITVSADIKEDLERRLHSNHIVLINNPVDYDIIQKLKLEAIHESPFVDKQDSEKIIIAVGRLHKAKNYPNLLRAFALLPKDLRAKLVILGQGTLEREIRNLINQLKLDECVYLLGFKQNPYKYMKNADLFVLSSNHEGFPNVITEALACGTMIVSTNCPYGPAEILQHGGYGVLVPVNNPAALAKGILQGLNHPVPAAKLMERARQFSLDLKCAEYVQAIEW